MTNTTSSLRDRLDNLVADYLDGRINDVQFCAAHRELSNEIAEMKSVIETASHCFNVSVARQTYVNFGSINGGLGLGSSVQLKTK